MLKCVSTVYARSESVQCGQWASSPSSPSSAASLVVVATSDTTPRPVGPRRMPKSQKRIRTTGREVARGPVRAEEDAGEEEAEDGREVEGAHDRRHQRGGCEEHHRIPLCRRGVLAHLVQFTRSLAHSSCPALCRASVLPHLPPRLRQLLPRSLPLALRSLAPRDLVLSRTPLLPEARPRLVPVAVVASVRPRPSETTQS